MAILFLIKYLSLFKLFYAMILIHKLQSNETFVSFGYQSWTCVHSWCDVGTYLQLGWDSLLAQETHVINGSYMDLSQCDEGKGVC